MIRLLGWAAMAALFLLISPDLRIWVLKGVAAITKVMNDFSPFSYIAFAIGLATTATVSLLKKPKPR